LNELARRMSIKYVPYFRGIFIRNTSDTDARRNESGLRNLDDATESGTHWVTYAKRNNRVVYFDSFDNLRLPKELVRYFEKDRVWYNRTSYQTYDQSFCGQMCLRFLQTVDAREFKKLDEVVWNLSIRTLFHVVDASTEREELTILAANFPVKFEWRKLRAQSGDFWDLSHDTECKRIEQQILFLQGRRGNYNSREFVRSARHKWIFETRFCGNVHTATHLKPLT